MTAMTEQQAQAVVDTRTQAVLVTGQSIPVLFGNVDDLPDAEISSDGIVSLSGGTTSFLRQWVVFPSHSQFELGNTGRAKVAGSVCFMVHVIKGIGNGERNRLRQAVVDCFRSVAVGGLTFGNVISLGVPMELFKWSVSGLQVPFYYYNIP